jgi:type IV pilus assembly protein PilC
LHFFITISKILHEVHYFKKDGVFRRFTHPPAVLKAGELFQFAVNLQLMLQSGVGIGRALEVLSESGDSGFRRVCTRLSLEVSSGHSFSSALFQQPKSFPSGFCRLIQSGEASGKLVACLGRFSESYERQLRLRHTIKKAVTYPAILLLASTAMVGLVLYLVFPMIMKVTTEAGVEPPVLTLMIVNAASPKFFWAFCILVLTSILAFRWALRNPNWGNPLRAFLESHTLPGRLFTQSQVVMSLRQLALMLESGVDTLRSLRIAGTVGDASLLVSRAFQDLERRIRAGGYLSEGARAHSVFPVSLASMLEVGEEAGQMHVLIYRFCDMVEDQIQSKVAIFSAAFEPILLGVMGLVVGVILLGAFLPVYQLVVL